MRESVHGDMDRQWKGAGAMTEGDVRRIVREEIATVLDSQAKRVKGITSWERYLQVLLDASRK